MNTGASSEMFLESEFWRTESFIPAVIGFPGNERFKLMSELKLLLKYCSFNGSRLFFDWLSEIKLTFDEKFQYGFERCSFLWTHEMLNLF